MDNNKNINFIWINIFVVVIVNIVTVVAIGMVTTRTMIDVEEEEYLRYIESGTWTLSAFRIYTSTLSTSESIKRIKSAI